MEMDTPGAVPSKSKDMRCRFCHKAFFKGEHLRRHERSHTGARPFVCKDCNRSFGRQDSLARHAKLHLRQSAATISNPCNTESPEKHIPSSVNTMTPAMPLSNVGSSVLDNMTPSTDLDFDLIWPDAEELFQSIISSDAATAWQMPLGTLPFPPGGSQIDGLTTTPTNTFDDRGSSVGSIPSGSGHQAVHDVSRLVNSSSSSVIAAAEAAPITSVFLDECLHMFFVRFIPTFPILHKPTFVFRECTHPLLLNAIAIGSLYLGPKDSLAKGEVLWRLAHAAIATSWEKLITHRGPYDACKGVQLVIAALLGQLYGVLSKNRAIRTTSQAFHTMGFSWARHCRMFDTEPFPSKTLLNLDAPAAEKDHQWHSWVAREIQHRALLAHYIIDGLTAQMSGEPTSIRHVANQLRLPFGDAAFEATNCNEWLEAMHGQSKEQHSFRTIYRFLFSPMDDIRPWDRPFSTLSLRVLLEGLQSLVSDSDDENGSAVGIPNRFEIRRALARLYDCITTAHLSTAERMELYLRWHTICLDTSMETSMLCRYICHRYNLTQHVWKDGKGLRPELDIISFASSTDARRALLHAVAIQDIVEQLPRGRAHAIHMPSSLFAAATVYSVFCLGGQSTVSLPSIVDWREALLVDNDPSSNPSDLSNPAIFSETTQYLRAQQNPTFNISATRRNFLYELNSMQKLFRCLYSQWGVAYDMESVLDQWITLCH